MQTKASEATKLFSYMTLPRNVKSFLLLYIIYLHQGAFQYSESNCLDHSIHDLQVQGKYMSKFPTILGTYYKLLSCKIAFMRATKPIPLPLWKLWWILELLCSLTRCDTRGLFSMLLLLLPLTWEACCNPRLVYQILHASHLLTPPHYSSSLVLQLLLLLLLEP